MAGLKETLQVNVEGAIVGVQEGGFSLAYQIKNMPNSKRIALLLIAIAIIPVYLFSRIGSEQYLTQQYARQALAAQPAFHAALTPAVGNMTIVRNPNDTYSGVVIVTNPNLDLAASGISYTATFQTSDNKSVTSNGVMYLLPNEKKYVVFPKIESGSAAIASGKLELAEVKWQKKLKIPDVKLNATEPVMKDEANPLTFILDGSVVNNSPYKVAVANVVFLLYGDNNKIIGVSQRSEKALVPYGRRSYIQQWPGLYRSQVKSVRVIPTTNTLDPQNISVETNATPPTNVNANNSDFF